MKNIKIFIIGIFISFISIYAFSENIPNIEKTKTKTTTWDLIKGSEPNNAILLGMWSLHFKKHSRENDRWSNELIGGVYKSFFAGTLINSFDKRAYLFGIQRDFYTKKYSNNWQINAGYRIGLITGYDERMADIAGKSKALPFPEIYSDFVYKHVGIEISWCISIIVAKFIINF